ncbi:DUF985 domain-containing protein [Ascosphaera apis ARSEF 7405]|uniref:DUF985 domain-containing protein n=1 Tax=Ascosphaera apis ARSEF 7405 TaxID=392613 RepID=A0A167X2D5_9EURO|nr:DUF985 domain-containing protein [Ascosphaera apis ARSEF 7405]
MTAEFPLSQVKPFFHPPSTPDPPSIQVTIDTLHLQPHIEGGFFVETDRDPLRIPNPFVNQPPYTFQPDEPTVQEQASFPTRSASTSIIYLLSPSSPRGCFHRNRARTVHTLHRGRGRYVVIHADEAVKVEGKTKTKTKARVEVFTVGKDVAKGEKLQWIVDGGKFKASYLLPDDEEGGKTSEGLLISETVIPGFEQYDHDFLRAETLSQLVTPEQEKEISWLLRKD